MNLLLEVTALTPRQLDYAIAKARKRDWAAQQVIDNPDGYYYRPSSDWQYCGPLLDQIHSANVKIEPSRPELLKTYVCRWWLLTFAGQGVGIPFSFLTEQQVKEYAESLDWT